jgi:hypothetical protein
MPQPSFNLRKIASYAVCSDNDPGVPPGEKQKRKDFRGKACKRSHFIAAIQEEAATAGFSALDAEEEDFVDGWLYATRHEYLDDNENLVSDDNLVAAIKRHVNCGGPIEDDMLTG